MHCTKRIIRRFTLLALLAYFATCATSLYARPLRVVSVVTGEGHDIATVSATLSWLLKRHDGVEHALTRDIHTLSPQSLQSADVVVLYAPNIVIPDGAREALTDFVQRGGGLLLLHTSHGGSFAEANPGNVVVEVVLPNHPVLRCVPSFQITDAPAQMTTGEQATLLARQRNGQPLVWVQQVGRGRICATSLGHAPSAWRHLLFQQMLLNAVYWCAGRRYPVARTPRPPAGFRPLFNGVNLEGWGEVGSPVWFAQDGVIICTGESEGTGWLRSNRMYRDFVLRLEYRISPGGNSGIFLRAPHYGRSSRLGMELQIQDDGTSPPSNTCTSAVYSVVTPRVNPAKPAGEWNQVEITLKDRHLRVVWNGQLVHDIDLDDPALSANLPRTHLLYRRPNWGYIGLQNHRSLVEFRNIFIRELQ